MSKRSPGPWYVAPEKGMGVDGVPVALVVDAQEAIAVAEDLARGMTEIEVARCKRRALQQVEAA